MMRSMRCLVLVAVAAAASITPDQSDKLRSLGYRAAEIAAIRPSVASIVARRGLPRPKAGMPPSWVADEAEAATATTARARPRPLAGVARFVQKLAFSVSMLLRDVAEVARRAALPVGLVLAVSQADRLRSQLGLRVPQLGISVPQLGRPKASAEGSFLYDGPCDPSMMRGAKAKVSPAATK